MSRLRPRAALLRLVRRGGRARRDLLADRPLGRVGGAAAHVDGALARVVVDRELLEPRGARVLLRRRALGIRRGAQLAQLRSAARGRPRRGAHARSAARAAGS